MAMDRLRHSRKSSDHGSRNNSSSTYVINDGGVFQPQNVYAFDSWFVLQENDEEYEQDLTEGNVNHMLGDTRSSLTSQLQSDVTKNTTDDSGQIGSNGIRDQNARSASVASRLQTASQRPSMLSTTTTTTLRTCGFKKASIPHVTGALGGQHYGDDQEAVAAVVGTNRSVIARSSRMHSQWAKVQHLGFTELTSIKETAKRRGKVVVSINVVFLKIGEIDTVKETFSADVFIQARWREPLFDNRADLVLKDIDWSAYWNPQLYVDNVTGNPVQNVWHTVMFNANKEAYVFERRRIAGTFIENLELEEFPFDTQDVTVTIVSERSVREVVLEEDSNELSTVNVQSFVDEQEWRLYRNVESRCDTVVRIYQGDNCCHSSYSALCHASRRYGFYVWNIMFVLFFISSLTFVVFAVPSSRTENRLQLTLILLLTTVTFKFAVNSSLPRISYLTYLDKYILGSMLMMGAMTIWHGVRGQIESDIADLWAPIALASFFVLAHSAFFLLIYFRAISKQRQYIEKDKAHEERIEQVARRLSTESARKQSRRLGHVHFSTVSDEPNTSVSTGKISVSAA